MNDSFPKQLFPLPYPENALEPLLSQCTIDVHYNKLARAACDQLNTELACFPCHQNWSVERLVGQCQCLPFALQTAVRHNAGSLYCHELYFDCMTPTPVSSRPIGCLAQAIDRCFTCFDRLWQVMLHAGTSHFGSGWLWLVWVPGGELRVLTTIEHNTPLMQNMRPILVCDLWEHAYLPDYQNKRAEYLNAWKQLIDWEFVEQNFRFVTGK